MWPRKGVVIMCSAHLVIRLSNGARVNVPHQKNIRLGDTVYVLWDYTANCLRTVWTEAEYLAEDEIPMDMGNYAPDPVSGDPEEIALNSLS
jgi:hypothetical protein